MSAARPRFVNISSKRLITMTTCPECGHQLEPLPMVKDDDGTQHYVWICKNNINGPCLFPFTIDSNAFWVDKKSEDSHIPRPNLSKLPEKFKLLYPTLFPAVYSRYVQKRVERRRTRKDGTPRSSAERILSPFGSSSGMDYREHSDGSPSSIGAESLQTQEQASSGQLHVEHAEGEQVCSSWSTGTTEGTTTSEPAGHVSDVPTVPRATSRDSYDVEELQKRRIKRLEKNIEGRRAAAGNDLSKKSFVSLLREELDSNVSGDSTVAKDDSFSQFVSGLVEKCAGQAEAGSREDFKGDRMRSSKGRPWALGPKSCVIKKEEAYKKLKSMSSTDKMKISFELRNAKSDNEMLKALQLDYEAKKTTSHSPPSKATLEKRIRRMVGDAKQRDESIGKGPRTLVSTPKPLLGPGEEQKLQIKREVSFLIRKKIAESRNASRLNTLACNTPAPSPAAPWMMEPVEEHPLPSTSLEHPSVERAQCMPSTSQNVFPNFTVEPAMPSIPTSVPEPVTFQIGDYSTMDDVPDMPHFDDHHPMEDQMDGHLQPMYPVDFDHHFGMDHHFDLEHL